MSEKARNTVSIDSRTWLTLCLIGVVSIVLIHSDRGGLLLFLWCMTVHLIAHKLRYIPSYLCFYLFCTGLAWLGVQLLPTENFYFLGLALSNLGILGRKAIVPISFAICLAGEPTGSLMASLQAARLPKVVGITVAVLLRFFPTIGGEYRAIRNSQRFRGIGVGVFHTLTHLPSTIECILIPLIIRTTKVAEELSASMTVRGVRFSGKTISCRPVSFGIKDVLLCLMALLVSFGIFLLEKGGTL